MSKRKTAQRGPVTKKAPESNRRWLIINEETGKPTIGCWNADRHGISSQELAEKRAANDAIATRVVSVHEHFGLPDPDAGESE